jgi:hypothetical protein
MAAEGLLFRVCCRVGAGLRIRLLRLAYPVPGGENRCTTSLSPVIWQIAVSAVWHLISCGSPTSPGI